MSNTEYATDVVLRELQPNGQSRSTGWSAPSAPPPTQPQQPQQPTYPDFAYITLANLDTLRVIVGDLTLTYDDYYDDQESGGDWQEDFTYWIRKKLYPLGIGMYETYDTYGCWNLHRFQNLSQTPVDIILDLRDPESGSVGGFGLHYLKDMQYEHLHNPSILAQRIGEIDGGYNHIRFTLGSCTRPDLVVMGNSNKQGLLYDQHHFWTKSDGRPNVFNFEVNGQLLINYNTDNADFELWKYADLDALVDALNVIGISADTLYGGVETGTSTSLYITLALQQTHLLDTPIKFKIIKRSKDGLELTQESSVYNSGGADLEPETSVGYRSWSGYLYDPLNFDIQEIA